MIDHIRHGLEALGLRDRLAKLDLAIIARFVRQQRSAHSMHSAEDVGDLDPVWEDVETSLGERACHCCCCCSGGGL